MTTNVVTSYSDWAFDEWNGVRFGDARLERRAISIGADMLRTLFVSPPNVFKSPSKTKAFYRFINSSKISREELMRHHIRKTKWCMMLQDVILNVHDATTFTYSKRAAIDGTYSIGGVQGFNTSGFVVQNTISVLPKENYGLINGVVHQTVLHRKKKAERDKNDNESSLWLAGIRSVAAPKNTMIIDVMDRGGDALQIMHASLAQGHEFVIRAAQDRKIDHPEHQSLFSFARALPDAGTTRIVVQSRPKNQQQATLAIRYGTITLSSRKKYPRQPSLTCAIVHVSETNTSKDAEPLEWFLLTSLNISSFDEACRIIKFYSYRWIIEEFHKCLKTGFQLETSQLKSLKGLENLLGFASIASVKLLQLRDLAREQPDAQASEYIEQDDLQIVSRYYNCKENMTVDTFLRNVAKLGGFLNRKSDGRPGWQTIWKGWKYLMTLKEGAQLYKKECG